jgi:hypothetical protein
LIFVSFYIGQEFSATFIKCGKLKSPILAVDSNVIYYIFTFLSAVGTVYTVAKIVALLSFKQMIVYFALHEANALKYALYEDYSIGIVSFRYLVAYSASIAIYRIIKFRQVRLIDILNFVILFAVALISTRLIFIATLVTTIFIVFFDRKTVKINFMKIGIFLTVLFTILSFFNYTRNANFYEAANLSFAGGGFSEIITYLGSPFQVEIGGAKIIDKLAVEGDDSYRSYVDISESLNTNSAFIELHEGIGYMAWLYITCVCFFGGVLFSWMASLGKSAFLLPCGAILYASAELWRVDLFQKGIFKVWLLMGMGVPLIVLAFEKLADCYRRPRILTGRA